MRVSEFLFVRTRGCRSSLAIVEPWHSRNASSSLVMGPSITFLQQLVLWCSWLSLLSNTQAVPGSNPGGIIAFAVCASSFVHGIDIIQGGRWFWFCSCSPRGTSTLTPDADSRDLDHSFLKPTTSVVPFATCYLKKKLPQTPSPSFFFFPYLPTLSTNPYMLLKKMSL